MSIADADRALEVRLLLLRRRVALLHLRARALLEVDADRRALVLRLRSGGDRAARRRRRGRLRLGGAAPASSSARSAGFTSRERLAGGAGVMRGVGLQGGAPPPPQPRGGARTASRRRSADRIGAVYPRRVLQRAQHPLVHGQLEVEVIAVLRIPVWREDHLELLARRAARDVPELVRRRRARRARQRADSCRGSRARRRASSRHCLPKLATSTASAAQCCSPGYLTVQPPSVLER